MDAQTTARPIPVEFTGSGGVRLVGDRWKTDDRLTDSTEGTVLLLHGGGQTRHSWDRTAARLAERGWRAVTLDARGHGDSEWASEYSAELFAADLQAVLTELGGRVVVVGASLGGRTGIVVAGERPRSLAGLVLVDITHRIDRTGQRRVRDFLGAAPNGFASLDDASAAIDAFRGTPPRRRRSDGLRKNLRLRGDGRWYWHWDPAFVGYADNRGNSDERWLADLAARITVPTLIVHGTRSEIVSREAVDEMLDLVPNSEAVEVDAGHMIAGDDNEAFALHLEGFLERALPPR
ncbi:alpha/beta fold hydrolase [Rhodococcus opacus]|uniref:Alpha/beta hydrolase n=1 Tax=Rhodococcus opacus TaxID=37919 RepID=A0A076EXI7_RHOOP|nr:alpha/beta hydrolase [Rhodococcus opacus]AII08064.1 alpha/beta hydrolase [Rhodococcus opacus]